jgi:hypothetical protein
MTMAIVSFDQRRADCNAPLGGMIADVRSPRPEINFMAKKKEIVVGTEGNSDSVHVSSVITLTRLDKRTALSWPPAHTHTLTTHWHVGPTHTRHWHDTKYSGQCATCD